MLSICAFRTCAFRMFARFCFVAVFTLSAGLISAVFAQAVFAQEGSFKPEEVKATPEILALFEASLQSLAQVEPISQAGALFQLLGFAVHLDDKEPAKKVITALAAIAPAIEEEELRRQLYEGLASALCDLEEYAGAVTVLGRIANPADRYRTQLNIAVKLVLGHEQDKTLKPFDASDLLRQVALAANQAQDSHAAALAYSLLGRELARHEKPAESAAVFAEALKIAGAKDELREQMQIIQLVLQSQVLYGQLEGAAAAIRTLDDIEVQRAMTGAYIQALIQNEKFDEAERLIKALPAEGAGRELFIQRWIVANIEGVTEAKVGEFAALLAGEQRESFLQSVTARLQTMNREDAAVAVSRRSQDTAGAERALFAGKMERLLEEEQFAEALQLIAASGEEEEIKQFLTQQVLGMQYDAAREEAVALRIFETYTGEDKIVVEEMRTEAAAAGEIGSLADRMVLLFAIFHDQMAIRDIAGARQTLKIVSGHIAQETDPVRNLDYRLLLARFQTDLQDNAGVKENLGKMLQMLAAVQDLKELKDLVPESESSAAFSEEGRLRLDLPLAGAVPAAVDESAIRSQLFQVYTMAANLLAQADAPAESKSAFEKAKALAEQETGAMQKAEKLLILAQFLAEER